MWAQSPRTKSGSATAELESCRIRRITGLPGSHNFASDFLEAIATAPGADRTSAAGDSADALWGLTADLSSQVSPQEQALYISKSTDGGATWTELARIDSRYFNAKISEGLRNGLAVSPGGTYFIITTQRGAFQIFPRTNPAAPLVKALTGPLTPDSPSVSSAKKPGEPVRANALSMTADETRLFIGYGYFDLEPQLFSYRKSDDGSWIQDVPPALLPMDQDILSMEFDNSANPHLLYVGTGDQAYALDLPTRKWTMVDGVGPDSAIHSMTLAGGLHIAACWGVYNPVNALAVTRLTHARFLLHRNSDDIGPNIRAYSIDVDPANPAREVVTSLTGVYTTEDRGDTWRRLNDLPQQEFRSAHLNRDGSVLVSGIAGTFLVNPFAARCSPTLKQRRK